MSIIVLFGSLAVAMAAIAWWLECSKKMDLRNGLAAVALFLWVSGVGIKVYLDNTESEVTASRITQSPITETMDSIAWPAQEAPAPISSPAAANIGPVGSLIDGLEARLAEQPDDAKGWALLAQSYAFVGNAQGVEQAATRAVELGFDEQSLRDRVKLAKRETQPVNWIEQAVGR